MSSPSDFAADRPQSAQVRELRRSYHDRIAELKERSVTMCRQIEWAVAEATSAVVEGDEERAEQVGQAATRAHHLVAEVDMEVIDLLALQSPVARDLRIILASRDTTQIGDLCMGLCRSLARRRSRLDAILPAVDLDGWLLRLSDTTAGLMSQVTAAWAGLDVGLATAVFEAADRSREIQRDFLLTLLGLTDVPVESALDLGTASRVYERLTDHAIEIAGRVCFAATGQAAPEVSI